MKRKTKTSEIFAIRSAFLWNRTIFLNWNESTDLIVKHNAPMRACAPVPPSHAQHTFTIAPEINLDACYHLTIVAYHSTHARTHTYTQSRKHTAQSTPSFTMPTLMLTLLRMCSRKEPFAMFSLVEAELPSRVRMMVVVMVVVMVLSSRRNIGYRQH